MLSMHFECESYFLFLMIVQEEKRIRDNRSFDIVDVKKQGISFVNRELRELNEDYIRLKSDYRVMQQTLVGDIIEVKCCNEHSVHPYISADK